MSIVETFLKPPVERRAESRRACLLRGDLLHAGGRAEWADEGARTMQTLPDGVPPGRSGSGNHAP